MATEQQDSDKGHDHGQEPNDHRRRNSFLPVLASLIGSLMLAASLREWIDYPSIGSIIAIGLPITAVAAALSERVRKHWQ